MAQYPAGQLKLIIASNEGKIRPRGRRSVILGRMTRRLEAVQLSNLSPILFDDENTASTLQGLRFGVEIRRRFWKIQKECRTEPALPVVVPPIPRALVFIPDLLQLDLIARERL
jgi:hypothetical protein